MAPPRVKHLLWRICRDCLPSRRRLRQHYVQCSLFCPVCDLEVEDDWHTFFGCHVINSCWREAGLSSIVDHRLQTFSDAKSLILDICCREENKDAGHFAMVLECIWKNRNNIVWNNNREYLSRIGIQAYYNWFDWFEAREVQVSNIIPQLPLVWTPLAEGWLKCNVDAGFSRHYQTTNRSWCVRDNLGRFIIAGVAWDTGLISPLEAEALAMKEGIHNAIAMNLTKVIFESDSQVVIHGINSMVTGNFEFNTIIMSIQRLLSSVTNFEVKFIKRQANMVADSLVKAANSWSRRSIVNVNPPCIDTLLFNEMN
ncbi:uncharacterized protein LOC131638841 [Vicia villosa]|uniref:uncharacterized protein LOC131638841 n=1 Tax=Vicia villosa TaxID=3911 RepID=UPI00273CA945|nr:uncharacterized protein LOC131638841 [Vicia villosa]